MEQTGFILITVKGKTPEGNLMPADIDIAETKELLTPGLKKCLTSTHSAASLNGLPIILMGIFFTVGLSPFLSSFVI